MGNCCTDEPVVIVSEQKSERPKNPKKPKRKPIKKLKITPGSRIDYSNGGWGNY
jgi:hypothetical protein